MPHLSSRFRRSKKIFSNHGSDDRKASPYSPVSATADSDGRLMPPGQAQDANATPALSLTTTTPPSSSHSSHSNHSNHSNLSNQGPQNAKANAKANQSTNTLHPSSTPSAKSHFRFHFRSSHKRTRSPAPASLPTSASPAVVNHAVAPTDLETNMTASSPAPSATSAMDTQERRGSEPLSDRPRVPTFLTLSPQDIELKYQEIQLQERSRIIEAYRDTSPSPLFIYTLPPEFKKLDRYQNIQPWGNNRVKLKVPEGCTDYINASPITLQSPLNPDERSPHQYIAMQGPKRETMEHAWRMVVEQMESPVVIVMLTETHEMGMERCFQYFPRTVEEEPWELGKEDEFGDGFRATIKCTSVEEVAGGAIEMRKINIHVDGQEEDEDKTVWHLLYRRWPDFGIPALEDIGSFFELMQLSREKSGSETNPRIIHCSAGVGRTGTFITLEHLLREVDSGEMENYDEHHTEDLVYDTVSRLREQRRVMVQSETQYEFIYKVLRKQWMEKYGIADENGEPAAKRLELDEETHDPFVEN